MTDRKYKKMLLAIKKKPTLCRVIVTLGHSVTGTVYLIYPVILAVLLISKSPKFLPCFTVPAVSFVIVTVLRALLDFERPYERLNITPLYQKTTCGKSFPSRHTFSVFVISVAAFYVYAPLGCVVALFGVFLAVTRVLCGVHFIRDVAVGATAGIGLGALGFYLFSIFL